MLPRANRLLTADEIRATIRRGRRLPGTLTVIHVRTGAGTEPPRFGFVVSKKVGGAVIRNRVRRRLREISRASLAEVAPGTDIVIRALPESADATWASLQGEVAQVLSRRTLA